MQKVKLAACSNRGNSEACIAQKKASKQLEVRSTAALPREQPIFTATLAQKASIESFCHTDSAKF